MKKIWFYAIVQGIVIFFIVGGMTYVLRGDFFFRYALAVANAEEEKDHRRHSERGCCHDPTCYGHCAFLLCCDGLYGPAQNVP